jgi:hypothetical protein
VRLTWIVSVVCLVLAAAPGRARADWLITPYLGVKFGGETNFIDLEEAAGEQKATLGGSAGWLGAGWVGFEADVCSLPGYFERGEQELVTGSTVVTLMGNVIVAAPLSVTKESLRPYVVGGLGLLHASSDDVLGAFSLNSNLVAFNVGGGALGFFSNQIGVRFDVRYFKNVTGEDTPGVEIGSTRLTFWRAGIGLVLRY